MNHTAFRPSVISERTAPGRRSSISVSTIAAGFVLSLALLISLVAVARADSSVAAADAPAGLFFKSVVNEDVFAAPTVASDVVIDISGEVARVNVRQRFRNPTSVWMEGVYVFPLPEGPAVDRLTMHIGDRKVEGRILEKQEAERVFREAADAGRHASLLSSARPNVFSTSVANIAPGAEIVVEIEYQDRARYADGAYSYRFPLVVAPRYTPGGVNLVAVPPPPREDRWPLLQRISHAEGTTSPPKVRDRDIFGPVRNPAAGKINPISLAVLLDAGVPLNALSSPNHKIAIARDGDSRAIVTLADGSVPADQDFVLNWTPVAGTAPEVGIFTETVADASHVVVSVLPPHETDAPASTRPRDVVFILDKSGSMHGPAIAQAKQAIRLAIARLGEDARFNLIAFDNLAAPLFNGLRPANEKYVTRAFEALDALEADGGTEMRHALELAFNSPRDTKRLMQVVFLTDGAVSNERDLFELIDKRLGDARLFTVGIGPAPNSFFMRSAAEAGRGTFTYIDDPRELDEKVTALLRKLERPAMTDLRIAWDIPGEAVPETYPARIPDLYFGEPITFATRLPGLEKAAGRFTITGERDGETWSRTIELADARQSEGPAALWARSKIAELRAPGTFGPGEHEAIRARVIKTALAYRLVTAFTSLVAVDEEEIARPDGAPLEQREIDRNLPDGMNFGKVFNSKMANAVQMAPLPQDVAQSAAFRRTIGLPTTATPATGMALAGLLAILAALGLILVARRRTG